MNWLKRSWRWISVEKNQKTLAFICGGLVVAVGGIYTYFEDSDKATVPNVSMVAKGNDNTQVNGNNNIVNTGNIYKSADYLALKSELEKADQHSKAYPDDPRFRQELKEVQEKIEDFKRDVLKLAEDFNKIPTNTCSFLIS